jgi:hypothetical protein
LVSELLTFTLLEKKLKKSKDNPKFIFIKLIKLVYDSILKNEENATTGEIKSKFDKLITKYKKCVLSAEIENPLLKPLDSELEEVKKSE